MREILFHGREPRGKARRGGVGRHAQLLHLVSQRAFAREFQHRGVAVLLQLGELRLELAFVVDRCVELDAKRVDFLLQGFSRRGCGCERGAE